MIESVKHRGAALGLMFSTLMIGGLIAAGSASATPDPVGTAFTDMEAKVTTYGAAIVAIVVLSAGIFLGVKYLRKGLSKA